VGCQRLGPRRIPACKQKYKFVFFYCLHEGLKGGGGWGDLQAVRGIKQSWYVNCWAGIKDLSYFLPTPHSFPSQ
jgi:hypothetical protein